MEQQQFIRLIENPSLLDKSTLEGLQQMAQEFPYMQIAQMLLAKNLDGGERVVFELQVKRASAYAHDRRKFQKLIAQPFVPLKDVVEQVSTPVIMEEAAHAAELKFEVLQPENQTEEVVSQPESNSSVVAVVQEQLETFTGQELITPESYEVDKIEQTSELLQEEVNEILEETKIEISERPAIIEVSGEKTHEQKHAETAAPPEPVIPLSPNQSNSLSNEERKQLLIDQVQLRLREIEEEKRQQKLSAQEGKMPGEETPLKNKKPSYAHLIDKFIEEEPRIVAKRDLPEEAENLAHKSSYDNSALVSETLALIYTRQSNYEKAIDTYEKLCLKFPEKSSYFAEKINLLKNQINKPE